MIRSAPLVPLLLAFTLAGASPVLAADAPAPTPRPARMATVTVTGAASSTVDNDRMHVSMRAEVDAPTAVAGAGEVNAKMAAALARAKAVAGVEARTAGYSTWQVNEKGKPARWRVVQTLLLEGTDFAQLAALVTRLQEDGVLLSSMTFSVKPETRRKAEDALTQQAIKAWQQRAEVAASALGYPSWRPGRITVNTGDFSPPQPMYRAQMAAAPAAPPPIAVEGGTTDITVTVSGDAILERAAR